MAYEISTSPPSVEPHASILKTFMQSFYATSDNPIDHDLYARKYFTADATLIMGGKRATGFDEILSLRKSLWEKVSSRKHTATKIFFGGGGDLMLFGKVAYVMKGAAAGQEVELDWAARAEFVFDDDAAAATGEPRMRYYQVYLDTAAQIAAAQNAT